MTIADSLGMPIPSGTNVTLVTGEETPEDRMLLPIGLLFEEGGRWYTTYMTRSELKPLLDMSNTGGYPIFDNRQVVAIRMCEIEGPECNLEMIYDFIIQKWRIE